MRLTVLSLDRIGAWVVDACHLAISARVGDPYISYSSAFDIIFGHLRRTLPPSLIDVVWRHLLHDLLPLVESLDLCRAIKAVFQRNSTERPASPFLLCRTYDPEDAVWETTTDLRGVRHLELLLGNWELQSSKLTPVQPDGTALVSNPAFLDLNERFEMGNVDCREEEEAREVETTSNLWRCRSSSSSSLDLDSSSGSEYEDIVDPRKMSSACRIVFPDTLEILHISGSFVANLPAVMTNCLSRVANLKILCLSDIMLKDWFFESLLEWENSLEELHLFRCPLWPTMSSLPVPICSSPAVTRLSALPRLRALSVLSCDWSLSLLTLRFRDLRVLDASLDLVTKVSIERAKAAYLPGSPVGVDVETRRNLLAFFENHPCLSYIGLINQPLSELEEVKFGRFGHRGVYVGGCASTQQMISALQYHGETQYLGSWGGKARQHLLKYSLIDAFFLSDQMKILKAVWTVADRDLTLFALGDKFKKLKPEDESTTKLITTILRMTLLQMKTRPKGCVHDPKGIILTARSFIFASHCVGSDVLSEMWNRLFHDFIEDRLTAVNFDSNPSKIHTFIDFIKRATMLVSSNKSEFSALAASLNSAYDALKSFLEKRRRQELADHRLAIHQRRPHPIQVDYEVHALLWMLASSSLENRFIGDFPRFLPGLRRLLDAGTPFLGGLDLLRTSKDAVCLPDGDFLVPVFGVLLHLLIRVPTSPHVHSLVDRALDRCAVLLEEPDVAPILSLLAIGIIAFSAPDFQKSCVSERAAFFRRHRGVDSLLNHALRVWTLQRGSRTSSSHLLFGFAYETLRPFLPELTEDVDYVTFKCLRARFADLAFKVFSPGYILFATGRESVSS